MKFDKGGAAVAETNGTSDTRDLEERGTSDMEERLQIDSLDVLHAKRRKLVEDSARLRALHEKGGLFDPRRKQFLEALKVEHRMTLAQKDVKAAETYIDTLGHADPRYEAMLDRAYEDKQEWIVIENQIKDVDELIANRTMSMSVYNSEARVR